MLLRLRRWCVTARRAAFASSCSSGLHDLEMLGGIRLQPVGEIGDLEQAGGDAQGADEGGEHLIAAVAGVEFVEIVVRAPVGVGML